MLSVRALRRLSTRSFSSSVAAAADAASPVESPLLFEQDVSQSTARPVDQVLGRYCRIGPLLMDEEIPRQFEKTEWSTLMQRSIGGGISAEERKALKESAPDRGGRWDVKPVVPESDRHIMLREPGVQLCKDLEQAGKDNKSFARILTGGRGVGKTATLLHALSWARDSGWLTMYMPRAYNLGSYYGAMLSGTGGPVSILPNSTIAPGLFQQPNAAQELLETTANLHGEILKHLPQRRQYKHELYQAKGQGGSTLAHILMRGLAQPHRAADALYDLRMEFNLIEEVPVLIAVDEFNALYWPTVLYFQSKPVRAHELVMAQAFRFVRSVPGDIEDDPNPKTARRAELNPIHLPKRGAIIGAPTRSLEAVAHKEQIPPARFEEFDIKNVDKMEIPRYNAKEVDAAMAWYQTRKVVRPQSPEMIGKCRVFTQGIPEKVAQYALGKLLTLDS